MLADRADGATTGGTSGVASAAKNLVFPVATAALGAAAGALVERRSRRREVFGIPIPGTGNGGGVANEIRKAGEQFGRLAREVRATRQKAEDIGKAIS